MSFLHGMFPSTIVVLYSTLPHAVQPREDAGLDWADVLYDPRVSNGGHFF